MTGEGHLGPSYSYTITVPAAGGGFRRIAPAMCSQGNEASQREYGKAERRHGQDPALSLNSRKKLVPS